MVYACSLQLVFLHQVGLQHLKTIRNFFFFFSNFLYLLTDFTAAPPITGWQGTEGLLLLHSSLFSDIFDRVVDI